MDETEDLLCSDHGIPQRELWEIVTRGELQHLTPDDDLSPFLPLLSRIALAHELRPQEGGPFEHLTGLIQKYPEANRCRHYAQLDWPSLLRPIRRELAASSSEASCRAQQQQQQQQQQFSASSAAQPLPRAHSPSKDPHAAANASEGGGGKDIEMATEETHNIPATKIQPCGGEIVAEFERGEAERRMQLLLRELSALVRKNDGSPRESLLLSKAAMQEELKAMLPIAYWRGGRLLGLPRLLQVLRWVDKHYTLLLSLLSNTPGLVESAIGIMVTEAARAADASREANRASAGGVVSPGAAAKTLQPQQECWWAGALLLVAKLSRGCAYRVRAAAMEASALPETVIAVSLSLINDPVPFLLGCTHGHEWLWEHLHSALAADPASDSPVQRLRASMSEALSQAATDKSEAMELDEGTSAGVKGKHLPLLGVDDAGGLGLEGLLRLYCALIALSGMQLTLPEVLGRSALPSHGETMPAKGGLLAIMCGMEGARLTNQARQLALCTLVLWPRLKSVIPQHVVAASIKSMWASMSQPPAVATETHSNSNHASLSEGGEAAGEATKGEGASTAKEGGKGGGAEEGGGGERADMEGVFLLLSLFVTRELSAVGEQVRAITALSTHVQGEALTKLADIIGEGTDVRELSKAVLRSGAEGGEGGASVGTGAWQGGRGARLQCAFTLLRDYKLVNTADDAARFRAWLLSAINNAPLPLPPQLPQLLEEAAAQCTVDRSKVLPLPLEALKDILEKGGRGAGGEGGQGSFGPSVLLAAHYLLARRAASLAKRVEAGGRRRQMKRLHELGRAVEDKGLLDAAHESLITMLPLRLLLAEAEQPYYEALHPQMLEHAVAQFPHIFASIHLEAPPTAPHSSPSENGADLTLRAGPLEVDVRPATVRRVLANIERDATAAILTLEALCRLEPSSVDTYGGSLLHTCLPRILLLQDRRASWLFEQLWERLFSRHPSPVAAKTIHALLYKPGLHHPKDGVDDKGEWVSWGWGEAAVSGGGVEELLALHDSLMRDVLGVLAVAEAAAKDPSLLRILLKTLSFYQAGSEGLMMAQVEVGKAGKQSTEEKALEEQLSALLLTQHSCLIQLLLELELPSLDSPPPPHAAQRRSILCQYIHQMFIRNPLLVKLVHFQRYDARLIPVLVEEVPSMHTCIPFLPELLSTADLPTRAFAILLTAEVARKYPLQQTEGIANLALQRMREAVDSDSRELLRTTLPILPVVAATFPRTGIPGSVSVTEQAVELLARIRTDAPASAQDRGREGGGEGEDSEGLDEVVEATFRGLMEKVLLLEGVAT